MQISLENRVARRGELYQGGQELDLVHPPSSQEKGAGPELDPQSFPVPPKAPGCSHEDKGGAGWKQLPGSQP